MLLVDIGVQWAPGLFWVELTSMETRKEHQISGMRITSSRNLSSVGVGKRTHETQVFCKIRSCFEPLGHFSTYPFFVFSDIDAGDLNPGPYAEYSKSIVPLCLDTRCSPGSSQTHDPLGLCLSSISSMVCHYSNWHLSRFVLQCKIWSALYLFGVCVKAHGFC